MNPALNGLDGPGVWDTARAALHLTKLGLVHTRRTAERWLQGAAFLPPALGAQQLRSEAGQPLNAVVLQSQLEQARRNRQLVLFAQMQQSADGSWLLHANDARGARYWICVPARGRAKPDVHSALLALRAHIAKPVALVPHGNLVALLRDLPATSGLHLLLLAHPAPTPRMPQTHQKQPKAPLAPHLQRLEAESIHILREAVAESDRPVMMYSVGKDSSVMLHLARKAFFPAPPPFPLLHVDTRWKFQEMYAFRAAAAQLSGMQLLVHINPEAVAKDINPFDHGSALHTRITKTEGLVQALDQHRFDVIFGGARRDEEKSRAKERIFSFRSASHAWDPKNQRPELWNLYNTRKNPGESIRVFPLSNWTELDIWQYIYQQDIPVVPLYFAKLRPVVVRDGAILMVDDARFRLLPGEAVQGMKVRFRTLGCYPLTAAVESDATSVAEVIMELVHAHSSERQGRVIDADAASSMEKKKLEGYF